MGLVQMQQSCVQEVQNASLGSNKELRRVQKPSAHVQNCSELSRMALKFSLSSLHSPLSSLRSSLSSLLSPLSSLYRSPAPEHISHKCASSTPSRLLGSRPYRWRSSRTSSRHISHSGPPGSSYHAHCSAHSHWGCPPSWAHAYRRQRGTHNPVGTPKTHSPCAFAL